MIRRPRYPLTLRLGWIEHEIDSAAQLLPMIVADMKALRREVGDTDAKVVLVAHLAVTALLPFGANPRKAEAFLVAIGPDGDLAQADVLAGEILSAVLLSMVEPDGEGD